MQTSFVLSFPRLERDPVVFKIRALCFGSRESAFSPRKVWRGWLGFLFRPGGMRWIINPRFKFKLEGIVQLPVNADQLLDFLVASLIAG